MNRVSTSLRDWKVGCVTFSLICGALVTGGVAQIPARDHIFLPPTRGATALSTYINAQASMIAATGDYLEAAAIARRHNAAAAAQEIKNSVDWVRAYFDRKELNRAYRQKYHPNYIQQYGKTQRLKAQIVESSPELLMAGDVTDEMNWMLDKLASHQQAQEIIYGDRKFSEYDGQLTPQDVSQIMLTDGSSQGVGAVAFKAARGTPLEFEWPLAFREPAFDGARKEFDDARQALIDDARDGAIDPASWAAMQQAIDALSSELQRQYPIARFQDNPQEFLVYNAARRFLKAKASMVFQARIAADSKYLTDKSVFEGDSLLDLLQFMAHHGLRFASPEPGGDASYRRLFLMMRRVYLQFYGSES